MLGIGSGLIISSIIEANNQLDQSARCPDGRGLDLCANELLAEIQSINLLNQKSSELSKDLNELTSLRLRRLANLRWRKLWNSYLPEGREKAFVKSNEHNDEDLSEHKLINNIIKSTSFLRLLRFYHKSSLTLIKYEKNRKSVDSGIRTQNYRTTSQFKLSIPKGLLIRWKVALNKISYLGFARILERLGYSHQSNLNDIKQVWFVPLLNSKRSTCHFI